MNKLKNRCDWQAEGILRAKPVVTRKSQRTYATIHLDVNGGEIVAFAHDESLVKQVGALNPRDAIRLTGIIEPRDPSRSSKAPYFLNVLYLEQL